LKAEDSGLALLVAGRRWTKKEGAALTRVRDAHATSPRTGEVWEKDAFER